MPVLSKFAIIFKKVKGIIPMDTKNIRLRPFKSEDQSMILDILTSSKVNQTYMLPDYAQKEDAIPLFRRLMELSENSQRFVRCIDLAGTAIGFLNDVEIKDGSMELGYVIHPGYHNRGYMTQALALAILELQNAGYREAICGAFEENRASQRVMEKCGMTRTEQEDTVEYRGTSHLCVYYRKNL